MGRHDWQLAVVGGDVIASIHNPSIGSVVFTTADFELTSRDAGRDNRSREEVVSAYCKRTRCDESFDDLFESVCEAIETEPDQPKVSAA